jgi:ATP-binding cassette, subfamily B, bacterial MsbA
MHRKLSGLIRNLVKATKFWQDNYVILREFKYFPRVALLAVIFSFLAASFEGVSIGFLLSFLQSLTTPDAKPIETGIEWFDIFVLGIHTSATSRLYRISGLILLSSWIRSAFNYLSEFYIKTSEIKLVDRLRLQTFEQLQSLSLSYFTKTKGGELINTITTETERVKQFFGGVAFFFTRSLTAIVYMLSILLLSWQLTIISILLFSLLAVGLSTLNARVREASFEISRASGNFTSRAIEFINGIRTVQAFSTQDFERMRYRQASDELVRSSTKVVMLSAIVKPLAEAFASTILIGMIIVAFTGLITHQALPVSSLLTFFFLLFRLVPIIQELNGGIAFLSTMQGAADNIKNLLSSEDKEYFKNGTLEFKGLERAIEFVDVDFGYDAENLVLRNITLMIERGKMTALVGASGAGKTTLADLIPRFYDPIRGEVLIDGVDVHKFDINTLRRKMAVVSQDTFIFNTSVRNNIAYGTEGASDEAIIEAARLANALDFIKEMPNGFDTQLGDRGVRLSGGQRQRIAIARALLRNPEILILDEATSALDSVSERLIQESLEKLSVGRTVIAIAHRLSTIVRADKVVVLEQGRIVEQGNYQELLEQRGKLWNYHQMQHESGYVG